MDEFDIGSVTEENDQVSIEDEYNDIEKHEYRVADPGDTIVDKVITEIVDATSGKKDKEVSRTIPNSKYYPTKPESPTEVEVITKYHNRVCKLAGSFNCTVKTCSLSHCSRVKELVDSRKVVIKKNDAQVPRTKNFDSVVDRVMATKSSKK